MAGRTITPARHRRAGSAAGVRRRAGAGVHQRRPPAFLSFVPAAPTEASILFDLVVGASSIYAGSWMEGAGAVYAENEALRWHRRPGRPAGRGRRRVRQRWHRRQPRRARSPPAHRWRQRAERSTTDRTRGADDGVAAARTAASPRRPGDGRRRASRCPPTTRVACIGDGARRDGRRAGAGRSRAAVRRSSPPVAPPTPASSTTSRRRPTWPHELGVWFHVDGAYGGAGLAAPSVRHRYHGIERADSFIVDPHKWLFAPFDCCALVYRDPRDRPGRAHPARRVPRRAARRRRPTTSGTPATSPTTCRGGPAACRSGSAWPRTAPTPTATPSRPRCRSPAGRRRADPRRAAPGTDHGARAERRAVPPHSAGRRASTRRGAIGCCADGTAFVVPTSWAGETVLRICIVNPRTTVDRHRTARRVAGLSRPMADLLIRNARLVATVDDSDASCPAAGWHHRRSDRGRRCVDRSAARRHSNHRRRPTAWSRPGW